MEAHRVERKLSEIFAADVEAYSRLMGRDEVGTRRTLAACRVIIDRLIASHRGRIFSTAGDSILADFADRHKAALVLRRSRSPAGQEYLSGGGVRGFRVLGCAAPGVTVIVNSDERQW